MRGESCQAPKLLGPALLCCLLLIAASCLPAWRLFEPEECRMRGALSLQPLASSGIAREAEPCFLKATEIARQQHVKSLELRAVMSLVRLRQQQATQRGSRNTHRELCSRLAEAHTLLSEVYNWFTEGFDTQDLQEAKTLLDSLESSV